MARVRKVVLDVLKPHDPEVIEFTKQIAELKAVNSLETTVEEVDKKVETVQIILKGEDIVYEEVKNKIKEVGGSVHSVDAVVVGE